MQDEEEAMSENSYSNLEFIDANGETGSDHVNSCSSSTGKGLLSVDSTYSITTF